MDLFEFSNTFVKALAADSELQAWGQVNFGKSVEIFADFSNDALPTADDMPYVLVLSPGTERGQQQSIQRYALEFWAAFDRSGVITRAEPNVTEPNGLQLICQLLERLIVVIEENQPDRFAVAYSVGTDTIGMHPEVHGLIECKFTYQTVLGENPIL